MENEPASATGRIYFRHVADAHHDPANCLLVVVCYRRSPTMAGLSTLHAIAGFSLVALGMVLTPGPNMAYLVSRSICQGRTAGLVSLVGIAAGFVVYMVLAACGITAIVLAVPYAYQTLRIAGVAYLGWLAWQAIRPGGSSPFRVRALSADSTRKLLSIGLLTSLLNPKVAVLYLSLLPQFIDPHAGSVLTQSLVLGTVQIAISITVNSLIVVAAGSVARFLSKRPFWARAQRWFMGTVLGALALRMALDTRR